MANKPRRWETKPANQTPAGPTAGATSVAPAPGLDPVSSFIAGLTDEEKSKHRTSFLHLIQTMIGSDVNVDLADGTSLKGVFHTATPYAGKTNKVAVKAVQFGENGNAVAPGVETGSSMILDFSRISTITAKKVEFTQKSSLSEFQTDSSIKKHGDMSHLHGRELQGLSDDWLDPSTDATFGIGSTKGNWDQFEANKRLFNVKSTFDENLYTKKLDLKSMTPEQIAHAERLAREIEGSTSTNIHLQEERGHLQEREIDEEEMYSGVIRSEPVSSPPGISSPPGMGKSPGDQGGKKSTRGNNSLPENNPWKRGLKLTPSGSPPAAAPAAVNVKQKGNGAAASRLPNAKSGTPSPRTPSSAPIIQGMAPNAPPGMSIPAAPGLGVVKKTSPPSYATAAAANVPQVTLPLGDEKPMVPPTVATTTPEIAPAVAEGLPSPPVLETNIEIKPGKQDDGVKTTEASTEAKESKPGEVKKKGLNPNAFSFNPSAKPFQPILNSPPIATASADSSSVPTTPQQPSMPAILNSPGGSVQYPPYPGAEDYSYDGSINTPAPMVPMVDMSGQQQQTLNNGQLPPQGMAQPVMSWMPGGAPMPFDPNTMANPGMMQGMPRQQFYVGPNGEMIPMPQMPMPNQQTMSGDYMTPNPQMFMPQMMFNGPGGPGMDGFANGMMPGGQMMMPQHFSMMAAGNPMMYQQMMPGAVMGNMMPGTNMMNPGNGGPLVQGMPFPTGNPAVNMNQNKMGFPNDNRNNNQRNQRMGGNNNQGGRQNRTNNNRGPNMGYNNQHGNNYHHNNNHRNNGMHHQHNNNINNNTNNNTPHSTNNNSNNSPPPSAVANTSESEEKA